MILAENGNRLNIKSTINRNLIAETADIIGRRIIKNRLIIRPNRNIAKLGNSNTKFGRRRAHVIARFRIMINNQNENER